MNFFNYANKSYSFERDSIIGIILAMVPVYLIRNFRGLMIAVYLIYFGYMVINIISFLKTRKHIDTYTRVICICGLAISVLFVALIVYVSIFSIVR